MTKNLKKTSTGYIDDQSDIFILEFHYNSEGVYIGQSQTNMLDDDGPLTLFFSPDIINGLPCVNGKPVRPLTEEEMAKAI